MFNNKFTQHGGVVPDGASSLANRGVQTGKQESRFGLYRGIVKEVIYPDDSAGRNQSGNLEYIVTVLGQDYPGVQDVSLGGGVFNGGTRVRKPTVAPKPTSLITGFEEDRDGEIVWVLFIGGDSDFPVIIGSDRHPRAVENAQRPLPSTADGEILDFEHNGILFKVDAESNFSIEHVGRKNATAATVAALAGAPLDVPPVIENPEAYLAPLGPTKFRFAGNGDVEILINETPEFTLKFIKADSKFELKAGPGLSLVFDGLSDTYELKTATGTTIAVDGVSDLISILTAVGTNIEVDGPGDKTTVQAAFGDELSVSAADGIQASTPSGTSLSMKAGEITMDGTAAKLKLAATQVGLGSATGEVVDLLEQTITQIDALLTQLQIETHTGNLGYPTSPPINAAAYAGIQALLASIKALVTAIKGGI